jgi:hypothetical protein
MLTALHGSQAGSEASGSVDADMLAKLRRQLANL